MFACLNFSDQEHLDKEIERLRKQLKVKVNRLFEAQGIGLGTKRGAGNQEGRQYELRLCRLGWTAGEWEVGRVVLS